MNQNDSNSFGFDQIEPPQHFINNLNQFNNELCKMMEAYTERMNQQLEQEALLASQREQELLAQKQAAKEEEELSPNFVFCQLIEEICGTKFCEEQKKNMEDIMLELLEDCRQKELLCIHNNVEDLIESALNSKLLLINLNSQRLDKEKQEVMNIEKRAAKRQTRITPCLKNFKVIIPLNKTPQISLVNVITPDLPIVEPDNSLSMGDEHLSTIPEMESNEVINSSVENFVPIPKHVEIFSDSNDDSTLNDDDSFSFDDIDYVEASPPDSELVSLEEVKDFHTEDGEIEDDILREKLSKINLLIAKIEAINSNPPPSSDFVTKSPSTFPNSFLEETNTFDNSIPESKTFCFDLEENSSGSTTTRSDYSLPDYEAFYFDDDHIEEKSSGSTTTHSDISLSKYDSFIFDLSNDPFPPADRSDFYHEEFADELAHIISPPEYDCFYFKSEPDPGELTSIVDSGIRENISSTTTWIWISYF
ncbi:hypothetical protein Tco_0644256 [Tanacetum coccineum]